MASVNMSAATFYRWRTDDTWFKGASETARMEGRITIQEAQTGATPMNVSRFIQSVRFRVKYFDHPTTSAFQAEIVRAVRECPPGKVIIVTGPPGGAKTTTMMDLVCEDIARDANWRGAYVHAAKEEATKAIGLVKQRMEQDGPTPRFY